MAGTQADRRDTGVVELGAELRDLTPILLTGATGQIGSECLRLLGASGVIPAILLRRPMPARAWGDLRVSEIPGDLEDLVRGEVAQPLREVLAHTRTVIHLAARVNLAGRGGTEMERLNYHATVQLFTLARQMGVARFLHVSTTGAVGCSNSTTPLDEHAEYNLAGYRNPYFDTKRRAEESLRAAWRQAPSPTALVIVNPSITLGRPGSLRRLARARRIHRPPAPGSLPMKLICFWFDGGLNLVDVRDVARGILLAAAHGQAGERYILAGENVTARELMVHLQHTFGTSGPRLHLSPRALRASAAVAEAWARLTGRRARWNRVLARLAGPYWFYDSSRAQRELGYRMRPLRDTLADLRSWVLEQRASTDAGGSQ